MKHIISAAKILITIMLFIFVFSHIDFSAAKQIMYSLSGLHALLLAGLMVLVQTVIAGQRLKNTLAIFEYKLKLIDGIKLWFIGNFFAQVLFSFVGGDAARLVYLSKSGMSYTESLRVLFLDRVLSFISLQILYFITLYFFITMQTDPTIKYGLIILAAISFAMIAGFILCGFIPKKYHGIKYIGKAFDLAAVSRYLFKKRVLCLQVLFLNILVHLCNVAAVFMILKALGISIPLFAAFVVVIPVMLISMLPITVGGWGVRENSMVIGLGCLGVSSEIALSASILFGLSYLLASLPGLFLLWNKSNKLVLQGSEG